jgi:plasmid stabilization system protein ParE
VNQYTLESFDSADADIETAFQWYQTEQAGLGLEFLDALRTAYRRVVDNPFKYQELRSGIRRILTKRFPYAVYFVIEGETIFVFAVFTPPAIPPNGSGASNRSNPAA